MRLIPPPIGAYRSIRVQTGRLWHSLADFTVEHDQPLEAVASPLNDPHLKYPDGIQLHRDVRPGALLGAVG